MSKHKPGERDSSSEKPQSKSHGNLSEGGELTDDDLDGIAGGAGSRTSSRTTTSSSSLRSVTKPTTTTSGGLTDTQTSSTPVVEEADSERDATDDEPEPVSRDRDGDAALQSSETAEVDDGSEKPDSGAVATSEQDSKSEPATEQEPDVDESESNSIESSDESAEGKADEGSADEAETMTIVEKLANGELNVPEGYKAVISEDGTQVMMVPDNSYPPNDEASSDGSGSNADEGPDNEEQVMTPSELLANAPPAPEGYQTVVSADGDIYYELIDAEAQGDESQTESTDDKTDEETDTKK